MDDLIKQELFELEVLNFLNSNKLLSNIVFVGGTMLRLCYNLNRYSVDLDFWIIKKIEQNKFFSELVNCLKQEYTITDSVINNRTMLIELKSKNFPRKLKIEIRRELKKIKVQKAIAYSTHSNNQVLLDTVSLDDMMNSKIAALIDRREIRDAFDIEFLIKKGVKIKISKNIVEKVLSVIESFNKNDYKVKLGSLLELKDREYYTKNNFNLLKMELGEASYR